jgi:hypothetical protein
LPLITFYSNDLLVVAHLSLPFFSDGDYEGPLLLCLRNYGDDTVELKAGKPYAQLVPLKYYTGSVLGASDFFFHSNRGEGGFGSTDARLESDSLLQPVPQEDVSREHVATSCAEAVLRSDN